MQNKTLTDVVGAHTVVLHLDTPLGKGSFGEVFACSVKPLLPFPTVAKVFKAHNITETDRGLIQREIQTHSQLVHPNIIRVLSLKIWSMKNFYLIMERADDTLAGLLSQISLTPPQTYSLIYRINQALLCLQQKSLVHQDIKPENILFLDGIPKLSDFGLVQTAKKLGGIGGSLTYLSPQKYGTDYIQDIRGDIFSLGLVAWKCLFGERAYKFNYHLLRKIKIAEVHECFKIKYNQLMKTMNTISQEVRPLAMLLIRMIDPNQGGRPSPEQLRQELTELQDKYGRALEKVYSPMQVDYSFREPIEQSKHSMIIVSQLQSFKDQQKQSFVEFYNELTRLCLQLFENLSLVMLCQTCGVELRLLKEVQLSVYKRLLYWMEQIKAHRLFSKLKEQLPQAKFFLMYLQNCNFNILISKKHFPEANEDPKHITALFTQIFVHLADNFLTIQHIQLLWAVERTKRYMQAKSIKEIIRLLDEEEKIRSTDDRLIWLRKIYINIDLVVEIEMD